MKLILKAMLSFVMYVPVVQAADRVNDVFKANAQVFFKSFFAKNLGKNNFTGSLNDLVGETVDLGGKFGAVIISKISEVLESRNNVRAEGGVSNSVEYAIFFNAQGKAQNQPFFANPHIAAKKFKCSCSRTYYVDGTELSTHRAPFLVALEEAVIIPDYTPQAKIVIRAGTGMALTAMTVCAKMIYDRCNRKKNTESSGKNNTQKKNKVLLSV